MKVLIIGDYIQDIYHFGTKLGLSAETPTLVAKRSDTKEYEGGSALVDRHFENLGVEASLLTNSTRFYKNRGWTPTVKERFFVDGYKLLQFDSLNEGKYDAETTTHFFDTLNRYFEFGIYDCVVIADNRHGVLNREIVDYILDKSPVPVYVNSQVSQNSSNHHWYTVCHTMFMNEKEAILNNKTSRYRVAELSAKFGCNIIVTLGERGTVACIDNRIYRNDANKLSVLDT